MGNSKTLGPDNQITVVEADGRADAADVNDMFDEISLEHGTHTHSLAGCIGHDALVGDMRWQHKDSAHEWALVCGSVENVVMGDGSKRVDVVFAEDAEQGNPAFTGQPTIGMVVVCGVDECAVATLSERSPAGFTAKVWERIGSIGMFTLTWWALGRVS